jgi:protein-arginine kinase activator protein McsA
MNEIDTPAFQFERVRSLNYLKATLKQIHEKKDNPLDTLKSELKEAVDEEDYEKAASIRDRIREAENAEGGSDSPEPEGDSAE